MIVYLFLSWFIFALQATGLNIGLHAQVDPSDKIVGSVITTNGIKAAFLLRENENHHVQTFYPMDYPHMNTVKWDLIIIEGWFPSINNFIKLIRLSSPDVMVLFYCLDPFFPSLSVISKLDVNGYLTNSKIIKKYLHETTNIPTQYILLAADVEVMKPESIDKPRTKFSVYVGAGGHMLSYKPTLLPTLLEFVPYGLEIYGSFWDSVPQVGAAYKGKLPENELAQVYADSTIVISSIIKTQEDVGMINNRVFEGLACGAILVSEYSDTLFQLIRSSEYNDFIYFYRNTSDLSNAIADIRASSPSKLQLASSHAREFIVDKHTWSHRVVEILDFYYHLRSTSEYSRRNHRVNMHLLAYITSDHLVANSDATYLQAAILPLLYNGYITHKYSEIEWTLMATNHSFVKQYETVMVVATPFDVLDKFTRSIAPIKYQSRILYVLGVDSALIPVDTTDSHQRQYDCIWFRDFYEMKLAASINLGSGLRIQQVFGNNMHIAPVADTELLPVSIGTQNKIVLRKDNIVFCYHPSISFCNKKLRQDFVGKNLSYTLILVGGDSLSVWSDRDDTVPYHDLPNIYHVADESMSFTTFVYAPTIRSIYILNAPDSKPVDTTTNVIWPLVNSLSSRASYNNLDQIRLFFYSESSHYISVVNSDGGCKSWNSKYLQSSYFRGDIRSNHLGSCRSAFNVQVSEENKLPQKTLYLDLAVVDFSVGVDGKVCIEYKNTSIQCIIQPMKKFSITFSSGNASEVVDGNEIVLVFSLVSIIAQDHLDEITCRFVASNSNNDLQISSAICDSKITSTQRTDDLTDMYGVHDILIAL